MGDGKEGDESSIVSRIINRSYGHDINESMEKSQKHKPPMA